MAQDRVEPPQRLGLLIAFIVVPILLLLAWITRFPWDWMSGR